MVRISRRGHPLLPRGDSWRVGGRCAQIPANLRLTRTVIGSVRSLAPLASDTVTTIVGFTEVTGTGRLHNTAAVFHRGSVIGLYRKLYPAINRSDLCGR